MKTISALLIIFIAGILAGCAQQMGAPTPGEPTHAEAASPDESSDASPGAAGLVHSFEFLGCSGMWPSDDGTSEVWGFGSEQPVRILVRHVNTCGYTIGSNPTARIDGNVLEIAYELSNTSGELAACECEYWATFELSRVTDKIERVSFNGADARLNGTLAGR